MWLCYWNLLWVNIHHWDVLLDVPGHFIRMRNKQFNNLITATTDTVWTKSLGPIHFILPFRYVQVVVIWKFILVPNISNEIIWFINPLRSCASSELKTGILRYTFRSTQYTRTYLMFSLRIIAISVNVWIMRTISVYPLLCEPPMQKANIFPNKEKKFKIN